MKQTFIFIFRNDNKVRNVWSWKRKHGELFKMSHRELLQPNMSDEWLDEVTQKLCKGLENSEQKGDVTTILSAPDEQHNRENSPNSCAPCGSKENLKRCDHCQVVMYCSTFCQKEHWYQHKLSCQQNQDVVEIIQTGGYKKLIRETHVGRLLSRRFQTPYNPGIDLATTESRESYGSYPMRRSDDVELPIRNSTFRYNDSINILFELGFLLSSFLFSLILIFGFFSFSVLLLFVCFWIIWARGSSELFWSKFVCCESSSSALASSSSLTMLSWTFNIFIFFFSRTIGQYQTNKHLWVKGSLFI